ncbi:hypothetical protein CBS147346_1269 [Aspergillus niger]|nr:hypothetical protein CBS147346_1269 [Aspergillus niger]
MIPLPSELKIEPNLKQLEHKDDTQQVQVFLRRETDASIEAVSQKISTDTSIPTKEMVFEEDRQMIRMPVNKADMEKIASLDSVAAIREIVEEDFDNYKARETIGVSWMPSNGTGYEGQGQTITVADTGFDTGDLADVHHAFSGRVIGLVAIGREWQTNDTSGHGTHVCGTLLGDGTCNEESIKGTAPKSTLVVQSLCNGRGGLVTNMKKLLNQSYFNHASRVHTNSWGPTWRNKDGEVVGQRDYDHDVEYVDQFIYDHPDMCVCRSAGNNGQENRELRLGGIVRTWPGHIGRFASAKNVITVGSCQNRESSEDGFGSIYKSDGSHSWSPNDMSPFSSLGPTSRYRTKPDVVAPGGMVLSTASRDPAAVDDARFESYGPAQRPDWRYSSGTSMATPQVAGCVAVLREILVTKCKTPKPTAALIKALLINGATSLGEHIPRTQQGFGRVNLANSIIIPGEATCKNRGFVEGDLYDEGDRKRYEKKVDLSEYLPLDYVESESDPKLTLKATMVYSDFGGGALQHNVNLCVSIPERSFRYGNAPANDYHRPDKINNVEQVVWSGLDSRTKATISVTLENALLDRSPDPKQSFALVWSVNKDSELGTQQGGRSKEDTQTAPSQSA